jgi:hypothetical protein
MNALIRTIFVFVACLATGADAENKVRGRMANILGGKLFGGKKPFDGFKDDIKDVMEDIKDGIKENMGRGRGSVLEMVTACTPEIVAACSDISISDVVAALTAEQAAKEVAKEKNEKLPAPTEEMKKSRGVLNTCLKAIKMNAESSEECLASFGAQKGKPDGSLDRPEKPEKPEKPVRNPFSSMVDTVTSTSSGKKVKEMVRGAFKRINNSMKKLRDKGKSIHFARMAKSLDACATEIAANCTLDKLDVSTLSATLAETIAASDAAKEDGSGTKPEKPTKEFRQQLASVSKCLAGLKKTLEDGACLDSLKSRDPKKQKPKKESRGRRKPDTKPTDTEERD